MIASLRSLPLLLLLALGNLSPAQEVPAPSASPFFVRSWQTDQGLPNNTVNAITQTHDGYLWLGTDEGLARFDGVRCRVYGLPDGLSSLQISALLEDHRGVLWIGTAGGGLSRLANGKMDTLTVKDGLAGNAIQALLETTNGDIWVGTPTGLSHWQDGQFETVTGYLKSAFIYDLAKDSRGDIWVATLHQGLLRLHDGQSSVVPFPPGIKEFDPRCVMVDNQDRVWVGLRQNYAACYKNGAWTRYGTSEGLPAVVFNHMTQASDGTIWVATLNEGLYYFQDGRFHALGRSDGLPDDAVLSLFLDRKHFLWVGTQSGGLSRIGPKHLSVYHVMENVSECQLRSLAQTTNGDVWLGTYGQGIYHWQNGGMQAMTNRPFTEHVIVEALLGGRDGSLWWGAGPAFYQWKDNALAFSYHEHWLAGDRIWSLCEDRGGGIWVGTYDGQLQLCDHGKFTVVHGLPDRPITALVEEPDGTLWIGSLGGGVSRWQNGRLTTFTTRDGLLSNLIRCLHLDSEGTLWIGTDGGGLTRWSQGRFVNFTTRQGLLDDTVVQILEDDNGNLWLGCNRGICRVYKRSLNDVAEGKSDSVHTLVFGRSDGMTQETCVGNFGAALKTQAGQLWFSTEKGIVIIDPDHQANTATPPEVLLEDILLDGHVLTNAISRLAGPAAANAPLEIPPGSHSFEFHFTGINFDAAERVRFKYQLEGLDEHWVEAGSVRVARYSYVPPGRYHFRVLASNDNVEWSPAAATLFFEVQPYFWQTLWFKVASVILVLGLLGLGIRRLERRRYRARLRRLEQEHAMQNERARIARDLHDELGSSLNYISMSVSDLKPAAGADEQFEKRREKISAFAVRTARSLDEIVWAVNPGNDSLRSLLGYLTEFAREQFEGSGVNCRFQIAESLPEMRLPPEMRHNIFLTIKEALTNTLKHAHAGEVCLEAHMAGSTVEISVSDNGRGFDPAAPAQPEHNGLANMRLRIESLGGRFTIESAPGRGTAIRLTITPSAQGAQSR